MRRLLPFILFWGLGLSVGCAPAHDRSDTGGVVGSEGTTGAANEKGIPFVTADPRMQQELREPVPVPTPPSAKPATPPQTTPNRVTKEEPAQPVMLEIPKKLSLRMQEFEISRFKAGETAASRFGDERMTLKIYFGDETVKFEGKLSGKDGRLKFAAKSGIYFISGNLDDNAPTKSEGRFSLTNTKTQETARILYNAFKAKLTVREDSSKTITTGSEIEKQIRSLRENTFGWVNNWGVVLGTSFYLVDIVKVLDSGDVNVMPPPIVAIKGQSLRTGDQDIPAKYTLETFSKEVSLIGNSESEERRWFQTKLLDPNTKEENDIIIDIQSEQSVAAEAQRNGEVASANVPQSAISAPPASAPVRQEEAPAPPAREETPPPAPQVEEPVTYSIPPEPPPKQEEPPPKAPARPTTPPPSPAESKVPAAPAPKAPVAPTPAAPATAAPATPKPTAPKPVPPAAPAPAAPAPAKPTPPAKPAPTTPPPAAAEKPKAPEYKPQTILEPASYNGSFLRIDNSLPRTSRMTKDFERNRNLPGVKQWIQKFSGNWRSGHGRDFLAFFTHANAFRPMMEHVSRVFDVSPMFAYVTLLESRYFTGGKYVIEWGGGGTSLGPFQFEAGTARGVKMQLNGVDERRYFAPSACGAARYFIKQVEYFPHDTTLAIMGYNQGEGGASRSIVCTYDNGDCHGEDWKRYMARAKNYKYNFADIATVRAAPAIRINYVEKSLAAYFIASDLASYGITLPPPGNLPANANILPPQGISDPTCREKMAEIL